MAKLGSSQGRWPAAFGRLGARVALILGALALGGCASSRLAPVNADARGVSVVRSDSVELAARIVPGVPELPAELTPIEISVRNLGRDVVSVELEDVELVSDGEVAVAVLPERIELRRPAGLGIDPASPFAMPYSASSAAMTPGTGRGAGGPVFEPTLSYAASGAQDARQRRVVEEAFTGGRIRAGEAQSGIVYFEAPDSGRVTLRVFVRSVEGREPVHVLEIPFVVES